MTNRLRILVTASILIFGSINMMTAPAVAQSSGAGECPDGFRCLTPDPSICLSKQALEETQRDLRDCREDVDRARGRLEECRDGAGAGSARTEELSADLAVCQAEHEDCEARVDGLLGRMPAPAGIVYGAGAGLVVGGLVEMGAAVGTGRGDMLFGLGTASAGALTIGVGRLLDVILRPDR